MGSDLTQDSQAVEELVQRGLSQRRACSLLDVNRSSLRYFPRPEDPLNLVIRNHLAKMAENFLHWGAWKMTQVLNEGLGLGLNHKRVERLYGQIKLQLPRSRPRKPFLSLEPAWERDWTADGPNDIWTMDFVHVVTHRGLKLRLLTVLDEGSRECLDIAVRRRSFKARDVIETLAELFEEYGKPKAVRTDKGPEFIDQELREFLAENGVKVLYIEPGCPWQNGFIESFNGKLRVELLDGEIILSGVECILDE
jgi:hypothetical protein